jgi:hypothetical protein
MMGISGPAFAQFGPPKPEVFARAEDQQRARLFTTRCAKADVGRGCYRYEDRLIREYPCTHHIETNVIESLPTDQCYKMERPRRYRGVWVDEFEGQRFIAEGTSPPEWPRNDPKSPRWRERFEQARLATVWLDASRVTFDQKPRQRGGKWFIEFLGRRTLYPGAYGHLGMSGQEIIVDRMISLRECPRTGICL